MKVISLGLGVNSVAMAIMLYKQGHRYPMVFADTGCEQPETYAYLTYFRTYMWLQYRAEITILRPPSKYYVKRIRDYKCTSIYDYCVKLGILPLFGIRWCTGDFKVTPLHRYSREIKCTVNLIGISSEEAHRADKKSKDKIIDEYPLIDADIDRDGCVEIIKNAGLDIPIKSGCYFCLYQAKRNWRRLLKKYPGLIERTIEIENAASRKEGRKVTMRADGISVEELAELIRTENPLFAELLDGSRMMCYRCQL